MALPRSQPSFDEEVLSDWLSPAQEKSIWGVGGRRGGSVLLFLGFLMALLVLTLHAY